MEAKKNRLSRRHFLTGLGAAAGAAALAACGATPTPQAVKETVVIKETVVVEAAKEPVTVHFLSYDLNQAAMDWLSGPFVQMVEGKHADIKVEVRFVPWGAFRESLMTDFVAGTAPDLFIEGTNSIPVYA
ncbi:MAG: twin-arginine translocation signal domain-containing protein, partial [Anaerolineae bacterium]